MKKEKTFDNDYKETVFEKLRDFSDCIIVSTETKIITKQLISFVVSTIKNKNHKLELMQELNILDVSFIRETREEGVFWRFEDHKGFRMPDRLTKELEERYQKIRLKCQVLQQIGRVERKEFSSFLGFAPYYKPIPEYKEDFDFLKDPVYFNKNEEKRAPFTRGETHPNEKTYSWEEIETLKEFSSFEAIAYSNPRRYRGKPILTSSTNKTVPRPQFPRDRKESEQPKKNTINAFDCVKSESEQKPFYKKLFNKFISLFD